MFSAYEYDKKQLFCRFFCHIYSFIENYDYLCSVKEISTNKRKDYL